VLKWVFQRTRESTFSG